MPVVYPTDGPVLTKPHIVSVVIFRNSWSSIYDFLFSKSSILPRHPFTGHSHRLSVTALSGQTATEQPHQACTHSHKHVTAMVCEACIHHTREWSVSIQWAELPTVVRTLRGSKFVKQQPTHYSQASQHSPARSPQLSQRKERVWTMLMRPDHCVQSRD